MLPDLLARLPPDQEIATVTADGVYDTRACHDAIADWVWQRSVRRDARLWTPDTAAA